MKHILLLWLFSCSLDGFSQAIDSTQYLRQYKAWKKEGDTVYGGCTTGTSWLDPDTLRCTMVIYYENGASILHTKSGFVVRQLNKENIYLDDRRRVIKSPVAVWGYKLK